MIAVAGKFRLFFTGGELREVREGLGAFYYVTRDVTNMLFPQDFEQRDREETDTFERLIFSDSNWNNIMQIIRTKDNEPLPIETLSEWIN